MATDSAGNLLTKGNSAYTYNNANRLSTYSESGVLKATYGYNAQNQRTVKQATRLSHYHYALDGKTLATTEYNTDGSLYQRIEYLWLDDMPVAQIRTDYVNNAVSATRLTYIHVDHLNTPRAMTDSTQTVVWRWDSDAFGFVPPNNDPDGNLQADNLALRFPGQLLDADNGLNINGFREYDPSLGRYALQSDPIGLEGGSWSTFAYVGGQPVSLTDPTGLAPGYEPSTTTWCRQNPAACTEIFGNRATSSTATAIGTGAAVGAGAAANSAEQCKDKDNDPCGELNNSVQKAKNKVGLLGACRAGMSRYDLESRLSAWLDLAIARAKRDERCWKGGDDGHQQAQSDAWYHVGNCSRLMQ